jgi:hypothetical protein
MKLLKENEISFFQSQCSQLKTVFEIVFRRSVMNISECEILIKSTVSNRSKNLKQPHIFNTKLIN